MEALKEVVVVVEEEEEEEEEEGERTSELFEDI
jgi:hypothetical protein